MADSLRSDPLITLAEALRGLPLESPAASAWPALSARVGERSRWRASRWPLALAAGLLALMMLPGDVQPPEPSTTTAASSSQTQAQVAGLMAESARLERLVAAASDDGASSATAAAWSLELEDRLQSLDRALEANRDGNGELALWQQRVQLLREVAAVETSRHYLSSQGRSYDMALVAAY